MSGGELQTNSYLVWDEAKNCLIIDSGSEGVDIAEEINRLRLVPVGIVATHGHFDHIIGALDLKLMYGIPFYASSRDQFLLDRFKQTAEYFLNHKVATPNIKKIDVDLDKLTEISLGQEKLEVIKTPGHTPGGVCLYSRKMGWLFSGDTVFAEGIGNTDSKYGSKKEIINSIQKKLKILPPETRVLPGHGKETTIARI